MPRVHRSLAPISFVACALLVGLAAGLSFADHHEEDAEKLFELRIYTTHPDKLDALNDRFRNHTNDLFEKHGMELVAYWTPTEGEKAENTLIYVLAYPDMEAREKSWEGFMNDPDWKAAYEASHASGPLVARVESTFMKATDYSPLK